MRCREQIRIDSRSRQRIPRWCELPTAVSAERTPTRIAGRRVGLLMIHMVGVGAVGAGILVNHRMVVFE